MADQTADAAKLRESEERRCRATVAADLGALDGLFDEGSVFTHSSGLREGKAEYLASLGSGKLVYKRLESTPESVTVWGDAAVIVGRMQIDAVAGGQARHIDSIYTSVWRRRGNVWRIVTLQSGAAAPAKP